MVYYYKHHLAVESLSKIKLVECTDFTLLQLTASLQGFDCVLSFIVTVRWLIADTFKQSENKTGRLVRHSLLISVWY